MKSSKLASPEDRLARLHIRFTVLKRPPPLKKVPLHDRIATSFNEIREKILDLEEISIGIKKKYYKPQIKTENLTPKSQATNFPVTPVTELGEPATKKDQISNVFFLNLKQHGRFEKKDGTILDLNQYFRKAPTRPSFLFELDITLKQCAVPFMPFSRTSCLQELKNISMKQDDTQAKHQFQFRVHNLSFRQYFDIINYDFFKQQYQQENEKNKGFEYTHKGITCVHNSKEYQRLLQHYRQNEKYFFQNKTTISLQLSLGELHSQETIAFKNLLKTIVLATKLLISSSQQRTLESVTRQASLLLQYKLEEMISFLASSFNGIIQFNQLFAKILNFKSYFFGTTVVKLAEFRLKLAGSQFQWFSDISEYVYGVSLQKIFIAMVDARDTLLRMRSGIRRRERLRQLRL